MHFKSHAANEESEIEEEKSTKLENKTKTSSGKKGSKEKSGKPLVKIRLNSSSLEDMIITHEVNSTTNDGNQNLKSSGQVWSHLHFYFFVTFLTIP